MNKKWEAEQKVLKKMQLHFTFSPSVFRQVKLDAADQNINTSDILRQILGFTHEKEVRPRIGLSFTQEELALLAERYNLSTEDTKGIRQCVVEQVADYYKKQPDSDL